MRPLENANMHITKGQAPQRSLLVSNRAEIGPTLLRGHRAAQLHGVAFTDLDLTALGKFTGQI
jgi:hypothetical protein